MAGLPNEANPKLWGSQYNEYLLVGHKADGTHGELTVDDIITKSPWVDVRAYGAVGDGATDDSTAINLAGTAISNASGGTMFFPDGTYIIDDFIVIYDNMRVTGSAGAILKRKDGTAHNIFVVADRETVEIDHLTFDGNHANQTWNASGLFQNTIYITNGFNINVHNCKLFDIIAGAIQGIGCKQSNFTNNHIITDYDTGGTDENSGINLHFNNAGEGDNVIPTDNLIEGNYIQGFTTGGIHLRGAHKNKVVNNTIINCSDAANRPSIILYDGDDDDGCFDNIVTNNIINTGVAGVSIVTFATGPQRNNISDNTFLNISGIAINVGGTENIISNNIMVDNIFIGIKINAGDDNIVCGNQIKTTGISNSIGIDVRDASERTLIAGNIISDGETGIIIRGGDNSIITDNILNDNTVNDIRVSGGDNLTITGNQIVGGSGGIDIFSTTSGHIIFGNTGVGLFDNVTANVTHGSGTSIIKSGSRYITVTSAGVNNIVVMPVAVIGNVITFFVGANGCELQTPDLNSPTINQVDCSGGDTNEAAIPSNTISTLTCYAANAWTLVNHTHAGAFTVAIVPNGV